MNALPSDHTQSSLCRLTEQTITELFQSCKAENWAGHDPYDALNSRLFCLSPFNQIRIARLIFIQFLKRCPVNLRSLLLIPKDQNPKALSLFLTALLRYPWDGFSDTKRTVKCLIEDIIRLRSPNTPYWCWGYCFPWQTRTVLVPRFSPNLVCTTFVANALLDVYESEGQSRFLEMALSAAEYILNELYWTHGKSTASLSYPLPSLKSKTHNANFLGAGLLSRVYSLSGDTRFLHPAIKLARYSVSKQNSDGSWDYGEGTAQKWVDNFHTGYNLCALKAIGKFAETREFQRATYIGLEYYQRNFFEPNGAPRYFHDRTYPIDIHSVAQSIITLLSFRELSREYVDTAFLVLGWALENMWAKNGYFYFQIWPHFKNRISYTRWSQAWMLLALTCVLEYCDSSP